MTSPYQKIVSTLDGVIKKNKTIKNIKVNRFDDREYYKSVVADNSDLLKQYGSVAEMLNSGLATFKNAGFTSTSYIPRYNFFKGRPVKTIINIPKGCEIYFTDNDDESEIIIPRNSKYDIISLKEEADRIVLEMNLRKE